MLKSVLQKGLLNKRYWCIAAIELVSILVLVGCGKQTGRAQDLVIISAATSLKSVLTEQAKELPYQTKYSFAGSDLLAAQIRQGITPDVFVSANTKLPEDLYRKGLVKKPVVFATNTLVIAVPKKAKKVAVFTDLAKAGVHIAMGDAAVPVGGYTRKVLSRLAGGYRAKIMANVVSNDPDVGGVVGKLITGVVDAGFVYRSDIKAAGGRLKEIMIPIRLQPQVAYSIAILSNAKHPQQARRFIESLTSLKGRTLLQGHGFGLPVVV